MNTNTSTTPPKALLAVLAQKGGVGATTTVSSLVGLYAASGLTVAAIDLDPSAFLSQCLGYGPVTDPLTAPPVQVEIPRVRRRGAPNPQPVRLFRGGEGLNAASANEVQAHLARARADVDLAIADVGGDRTNAVAHAVVDMMDFGIVPLDADLLAYRGATAALAIIRERRPTPSGVPPARLLKSRWDDWTNMAADVEMQLGQHFTGLVLTTTVGRDQAVREAVMRSLPVTSYRPTSRAALAYKSVAREVAGFLNLNIVRGAL
jgi:chromosome partitioning protein